MPEKKEYDLSELMEQNIKSAPSLDLPARKVERFFTPKDGGDLFVFLHMLRKIGGLPTVALTATVTLSYYLVDVNQGVSRTL